MAARRSSDARLHFAKAFELGSRNPRMLWDYGRMAESADTPKAIQAFTELLKQDPDRLEVRLELASAQLHSHAAKEALQTLAPVKKVTPKDAPRLITLLAYASLEVGDLAKARTAAEQLKRVSTVTEDQDRADRILRFIDGARTDAAKPVLALAESDVVPYQKRRDTVSELERPVVRGPSFKGTFVELRCGEQAIIVIETAEGKKLLLIEDPTKLLVNGKGGATMDLSCGSQKPVEVRIEYGPSGANRAGIDGIARVINFEP